MAATSVATVVSFESVGAILVIAFLVVPAATAYLLTKDLRFMVLFIVLQGLLSAVGGYLYPIYWRPHQRIDGGGKLLTFCTFFILQKKEG